jgi:hypothetical protein
MKIVHDRSTDLSASVWRKFGGIDATIVHLLALDMFLAISAALVLIALFTSALSSAIVGGCCLV